MLRFLRVRNFALLDRLELDLEDGFNLLSGETGADKSILVDALGLLAGSKASGEMIRGGESRAIVEAVFEADLPEDLDRLGIETEGSNIIIKREISNDGRNRVFINNQPSTVAALKELAPALLDIHGQHDQQTLLDAASQLTLVDVFAGVEELASSVRALHSRIQSAETELAELIRDHARKVEQLDFLAFQREEIQKADPKPGEADQHRERLDVLSHAGKLMEAAARGYETLYESEESVTSRLAQTEKALRDASPYDKRLEPMLEQTAAARLLIQDLALSLRDYAARVESDPRELERLQSRLAELERLHRKYGPDLTAHLDKVRSEMDSIGLAESHRDELVQELETLRNQYRETASVLSGRRRDSSKRLAGLVVTQLKSLAMPHARFEVRWSDVTPGGPRGIDRLDFCISANPGEDARPLDKIASGGELSRVMLALRTVLAVDRPRKTLVFDEVDAGIGGKAAETVGKKLQELSSRYQVLCVTHLAQIAAFSDHQYRIEKLVLDGRTVTRIEPLAGEARVEELARMMSGSRVTDAARQHIKELLADRS